MGLLGMMAALWAEKFDHLAAVTNFVVMPMTFLSGTFYLVENLPEPFRTFSQYNPFFYMIAGFRYGFTGHTDGSLAIGVAVTAGLVVFLWVGDVAHVRDRLQAEDLRPPWRRCATSCGTCRRPPTSTSASSGSRLCRPTVRRWRSSGAATLPSGSPARRPPPRARCPTVASPNRAAGTGSWSRRDDLDALAASLRAAGVVFRNEIITGPGGRQTLCEDPSGNAVELFQAG